MNRIYRVHVSKEYNYISFDNRTTCSLFHFVAPSGMFVYISIMRSCNSSPSIVHVSCFMEISTLFHNLACFFLNPFGCLKLSLAQLYRSILVAAFMSSHSNNAHNGFTTQRIGVSISVVRPNVTFLFPFDLFKMKKRCRNSVVGDKFRNSFKKVSIHLFGLVLKTMNTRTLMAYIHCNTEPSISFFSFVFCSFVHFYLIVVDIVDKVILDRSTSCNCIACRTHRISINIEYLLKFTNFIF